MQTVVDKQINPDIEHRRARGLRFLGIAAAAVGFALTLQIALNTNFASLLLARHFYNLYSAKP
jgi:hypothetical protein